MDENSRELLVRYEQGDAAAARAIHERYAARLIAVARRMLARSLTARVDPEDVVQSAYRSFFVKAREGRFELHESGDLWRLLIAITRHKMLHEVERQTAAKRSREREVHLGDWEAPSLPEAPDLSIIAEELQAVLEQLSPADRQLIELRLQDASIEEMAAALHKSPRTVRRMLQELRQQLERRLAQDDQLFQAMPAQVGKHSYRSFRLEQMVGAGGFGKVYRALWIAQQTTVAIKALRKRLLLDARATQAFLREAEIIAALQHPGIVRSHGIGQTPGGGYFLVLDWHAGGSLAEASSLSCRQVIDFVRQAAQAIAYAHEHGVVHCDLKPSNLLIAADGRLVITDFGFAVATARSVTAWSSPVGGTPGFLAPEISNGHALPASDVYSLGRVLRFLLERVHPAESDATMHRKALEISDACERTELETRPTAHQLAESLRSCV